MIEFKYIIRDPLGLHGRPSKELVLLVSQLDSNVTIRTKNSSANASSMIRVMSLGVVTGTEITISIDGGNEKDAYQKLSNFFHTRL